MRMTMTMTRTIDAQNVLDRREVEDRWERDRRSSGAVQRLGLECCISRARVAVEEELVVHVILLVKLPRMLCANIPESGSRSTMTTAVAPFLVVGAGPEGTYRSNCTKKFSGTDWRVGLLARRRRRDGSELNALFSLVELVDRRFERGIV